MSKSRTRRGIGIDELRGEIESGKRVPFYLLQGEEEFEREETCAWLVDLLAPDQARDFNVDVFHGDDLVLQEILQAYASYPMMASQRLVLLRGCEKLSAEACRGLEKIVETPLESTFFIAVGGKVDLRRKFFQQLAKQGRMVEFRLPFDNQIPQWIQRHTRKRGLIIEPEAVDLLRLYVGGNLRELASEIEKLSTFVGEGEKITRQAVERVVGALRSISIFEFIDAIGARDHPKSMILLQRLLEQGEEPVRAVAMICRHFQLLLKAQTLVGRSLSRQGMAGELGVSPYFLESYLDQARRYPRGSLWAGLGALLEADSRLKSQGRRQEHLVMDLLVQRLCAPPRTHRQA